MKTPSSTTTPTATSTGRKNNTKMELKLPVNGIYTIEQLHQQNPDFKEITLRVRLRKLIDANKVSELGTLHMAKGRPVMVCATTPVSAETIAAAKTADVTFREKYNVVVTNIQSKPAQTVVSVTPISPLPSTIAVA